MGGFILAGEMVWYMGILIINFFLSLSIDILLSYRNKGLLNKNSPQEIGVSFCYLYLIIS